MYSVSPASWPRTSLVVSGTDDLGAKDQLDHFFRSLLLYNERQFRDERREGKLRSIDDDSVL